MSGKRRSPRLAEKQNQIHQQTKTLEALLNDIILQNIFKYLDYRDLKSIRDVKNTIWLRNSKKAWWSRAKVVLQPWEVQEYLNQTEIIFWATNLELRNFDMGKCNSIWYHFGHSIKHLELHFCAFNSEDEFRQTIYTKCPNLEKLVTRFLSMETSTVAVEPMEWQEPQFGQQKNLKFLRLNFLFISKMPLSWMELLSHFPNLEAIEASSEVDIYKVISIIRQHDPRMLKLKHIDIKIEGMSQNEHEDEESLRPVLLDPSLSFETIRIRNRIYEAETLVDILNLHAKSLRELFVECDDFSGSFGPSLRQPLLKLEILSLNMSAVDIFKWAPNVRKVHFNYDEVPDLQNCADPNIRIDTCKELEISIEAIEDDSPKSGLEFCLNAFPNVEILKISELNNERFSMICERWTKLVSFTVSEDSQVNDFGLLGFDPKSKTKTARNPNITNLKDLQAFSMTSKPFPVEEDGSGGDEFGVKMKNGNVILTELKKLERLKKLELEDYQLKEEKVWKKIFAKYPSE